MDWHPGALPGGQKSKPGAKNLDPAPVKVPVYAGVNTPAQSAVSDRKSKLVQLVNALESPSELADNLSEGMYNFYTPIDISLLRKEVSEKTISDNDFRDLCIYDFVRSAASIRKRHGQSAPGSWRIAMRSIDRDFGCINFMGQASDKVTVLERLVEFRYRLRWALKWFEKRPKFRPLHANDYFDNTRTLPSQVGWSYTRKVWTKELKRRSKNASDKSRKIARTKAEKERLSIERKHRKAIDQQIYSYLRGEINYDILTGFVARLPEKLQKSFPDRLDTLNKRRLTKKPKK